MVDGSCMSCGAPGRCECEKARGSWFTTHTRKRFFCMDPRPEEIDIRDIAHHLARTVRFCGAVDGFYSVAQHSINVAAQLAHQGFDREMKLAGLLHDATEAYMGDVVRPWKHETDWGRGYRLAESKLARVIERRFGLPQGALDRPEIKVADRLLLHEEASSLFNPPLPWAQPGTCLVEVVAINNFRTVEEMFLCAFHLLGGGQ